MSLVIVCFLFSSIYYIPVKGEIIWYLSLTVWLISLNIMLSSSIHAIKNNLTMDRGSGEGTVRRGDYRNFYKGHMDKIKGEGGGGGGSEFQLQWVGGMGRKGTPL